MALQDSADIDVARLERSDSFPDHHSYEASVPSSASTSQVSVFSDNASEKSSVASSTVDDFRLHTDDRPDIYCASAQVAVSINHQQPSNKPQFQSYPTWADVTSVPLAERQHPRRSSLARSQKPPPLVRQADRKHNFVDNLVESATQMVEVIWPLSVAHCKNDASAGRGVLPLRTYIEETLRRSRTSYSTLQVALYYLVLIKAYIPQQEHLVLDSAMDCQSLRALMCGRRMFLAALILASKYLQDRNYSAKAWSRMSGLRVAEINANERVFLEKICWKLHVAKPVFDRWTEIVLKFTPSNQPPSPSDCTAARLTWKALIPQLRPDLSGVPIPAHSPQDLASTVSIPFLSPVTPIAQSETHIDRPSEPASQDITPTPSTIAPPRFLEPKPTLLPPTPGLVRMGPLPTPQMTPSSVAASTPAASACNSRRPSICSAMAMAQRFGITRCTTDEFPFPSMDKLRMASRRQSITSLPSTRSSPESIVTDTSYSSSRASSILSATTMSSTSACPAPRRGNLARLATTRNCRMAMSTPGESDKEPVEGSATRPITIAEESDEAEPDFTVNERKLHAPHRHSKHAPHAHHITAHHVSAEKCRKRHRQSRGSRKSDLYDEVRHQLEDEQDDAMIIDSAESDEDMTSPSPASSHASSMLRRESMHKLQARALQPPASLTMSPHARVPLARHDGSKRACYSHVNSNSGNAIANNHNNTLGAFMNASLYMEIA